MTRDGLAALLLALTAPAIARAGNPELVTTAQRSYVLACGGCHGIEGTSNSRFVPQLRDTVGYFLNSTAGREYLVRLPNVAFSNTSDRELADLLNFMVFQLGGHSVPGNARPYAAAEVARLRKRPLTEVSLTDYRTRLIATLGGQPP